MKQLITLTMGMLFMSMIYAQESPAVNKTAFTQAATEQPLFDRDDRETTVGAELSAHRGKVVLVYVWAGWCPDCINGFPELKTLQKANPDMVSLFLSLDRTEKQWKETIEKFELEGEHFWFKTDWKNAFTDAIDLNWVPRYLIVDPEGGIAHYYAVKADDPALQEAINAVRQ